MEPMSAGAGASALDFAAIYQEHFDLVWRTLRRYGVLDAAIDDAAQDVFMVVHARLASFEGRSALRTWVFGIARRVARGHRLASRVRAGQGGGAVETLPDVVSKSPLANLEAVEAAHVLESLLASLTPKKREAFILVELEQMTVVKASKVLGVSSNTLYSRVRAVRLEFERALARLEAHSRTKGR
jgi:RNA polymerase sigma-70 factor (ECF subfamily)